MCWARSTICRCWNVFVVGVGSFTAGALGGAAGEAMADKIYEIAR